ncbi:MAG: exodeoxyribonuclease VII large subunit [Clostridia bacterium]|nr:exodeoxyribonuclease VII large subunit [Clostridia bacterium]
MRQSVTVGELNEYVKSALENDPMLRGITLIGEVSGYKKYPSGHAYFTLKDEHAAISCVCFAQYQAQAFMPQNGQLVEAVGSVSVYVKEGRYQFIVRAMRPAGVGALYVAFEKLKKQLQEEGLFDLSRKRPIPKLPACVGVVTSGKGAAVRDIIHVISRRYPRADILICPVAVQGAQSAPDIARGIRWMNDYGRADVLIVGRGGGSAEDLWAFNTEIVARAIADSKIPVISAVGHETDTTIADFVSDLRAPTPSAAAELAVPVMAELEGAASKLMQRAGLAVHRVIDMKFSRMKALLSTRQMAMPARNIEKHALRLQQLTSRLSTAVSTVSMEKSHQAQVLTERLSSLDPKAVMARGFAMVTDEEGKLISTSTQKKDGIVTITWRDGCRQAEFVSNMEE